MKLLIDRSQLNDAVNIASKAIPVRTTSTILKCFLIDASDEVIRLTGNNNDLGIETKLLGEIQEHGSIAIQADVFSNIVRKLPDGIVSVITEGEKVTIRCEKAVFHILGMDPAEFPPLPEISRERGIEVSEFTLREMIAKTIFSVSSNDSNLLMTGELFEVKNNILRTASLDGHRISIRREELKNPYDDISVVIPGKALSEISKILSGSTEDMAKVYFTDRYALFEFGSTSVVTRLIEGKYFDVDSMLSSDYKLWIRIHRQEMLSCLERSILLVREEDKKPIILIIEGDQVEFRINSALGSLKETIAITKEGNDLTIGFNPRFLIDALRAIDDEEITIYLSSQRAPAFIRDDHKYCYLILPINFITI